MTAWIWQGNVSDFPITEYLATTRYIYWATPRSRDAVKVNDLAYIRLRGAG
jgi:hypothetical protein